MTCCLHETRALSALILCANGAEGTCLLRAHAVLLNEVLLTTFALFTGMTRSRPASRSQSASPTSVMSGASSLSSCRRWEQRRAPLACSLVVGLLALLLFLNTLDAGFAYDDR